ncbi:MAG: hypothetical protein GY750_14540 [Lentisphaerae bacterium]|nr:hypothetical protein [Lentisphaerota bacterium]MCP4102620.1 hypothetical protein [Lentisphaerota bacterium]
MPPENFFVRTHKISTRKYHKALEYFEEDSSVDKDEKVNSNNQKYYVGGPQYSTKYFNCHKYAVRFLARVGVVDSVLLEYDYPFQANFSKFQVVTLSENGSDLLNFRPPSNKKPHVLKRENKQYPSRYYKIASSKIGKKLSTTKEIKEYINITKQGSKLIPIAIELMNNYRTDNASNFFHFKRHNTQLAKDLIKLLQSNYNSSAKEFKHIINKFTRKLPLSVNVTGSFFKRMLFLKELVQSNSNI